MAEQGWRLTAGRPEAAGAWSTGDLRGPASSSGTAGSPGTAAEMNVPGSAARAWGPIRMAKNTRITPLPFIHTVCPGRPGAARVKGPWP